LNRRVQAACITPTRTRMAGEPYREYAGQRGGRYINGRYVTGR
jgi:hypothetical protein